MGGGEKKVLFLKRRNTKFQHIADPDVRSFRKSFLFPANDLRIYHPMKNEFIVTTPTASLQEACYFSMYLDDKCDELDSSQRVSVERVEVVVSHDGRLQDVATLPVQHKQRLVHLHGLIYTEKFISTFRPITTHNVNY